jgi:malonyl-CoA/methylmalonyl-CoA synthetase
MTLVSVAQARLKNAEHIFIESDDGRTFSYGSFWDLAGKLAGSLRAAGAKPGDRVAVQIEKSVEAIALFFACARAGLVFLPLNTAYTTSEILYFLQDAEPAVFICETGKDAGFENAFTLASLQNLGGTSVDVAGGEGSLAAILYTSGTTGKSKGAMLSHGNLASNAAALAALWQFTPADVLIHALPVYHTHGLFVATNTVYASGGKMLFRRKFVVDDVIKLLPQATALMGVPTFYTRLLQHDSLTREATQHMRLFVSGSAPLLAETHRQFLAQTGHAILERYGMTETNMNTSNPHTGERRAGTVGKALPGVEVRVVEGSIEVRGPNLFKGYWRNPKKTAAEFTSDGFFMTGDLGSFDAQGYLIISGRAKDLIITGGFNVYPKEVEDVLDAIEGVVESAVIGLPDPDFGEVVTAVVVAEKGALLVEAEIIHTLKLALANFKCPKRIFVVEALPRNAMGKVQKNVLRTQFSQ